jgi:hypothetical protein
MLWDEDECGRTKVMRISRKPSQLQVTKNQKEVKNVEYFNFLGCMITKDARCLRETKTNISVKKGALNRNKTFH